MVIEDLTYKVIGCCMEVHTQLGPGLLEACYHNALFYELKKQGLKVKYNAPFTVQYDGHVVGEYFADLVVEDTLILELKSVQGFSKAHSQSSERSGKILIFPFPSESRDRKVSIPYYRGTILFI